MRRAAALLLLLGGASATDVLLHRDRLVPHGWEKSGGANKAGRYRVQVGVRRTNTESLTAKLLSVSDPKSPEYLQHLSWEEAGEAFRPKKESIEAVLSWLYGAGANAVELHPHGDIVKAELTVQQLESATGGRFERFTNAETGRVIDRLTGGVRVPVSVADHVDTFTGFHGFPLDEKKAQAKTGVSSAGAVTPKLINTLYNVTQVKKSGKRNIQAIAQFQGQYVSKTDLAGFCEKYEPEGKSCAISEFHGKNQVGEPGIESMLDTEYVMGLGQGSETWVYSYPSFDFCSDLLTFGGDLTANSTFPYSVSVSYGSQKIDFCDSASIQRLSTSLQKAALQGITIMISSGDDGSGHVSRQGTNTGKVAPSYPASIPWVTAVGGTYFVSGTSGEQEATTQFGSGGGFSWDFDAPSYQTDAIKSYLSTTTLPSSSYAYAKSGRGSPDVSLLAEQFTVEVNGKLEAVGGTSASSPSFAALVTLLNEVCLTASGKSLGFANPLFYQNAAAFTDIVKGTNAIGSNAVTKVWKAEKGWDASTGLGVPKFDALAKAVQASCAKAAK